MVATLHDRLRWLRDHLLRLGAYRGLTGAALLVGLVFLAVGFALAGHQETVRAMRVVGTTPSPLASAAPTPSSSPSIPPPAPAPADLPVVDYGPAPTGFPADPAPLSTAWLAEGAHPLSKIAAYDAPGGRPLAYLTPTISGVPITMPVVDRRTGWVAVLLPSTNRTVAWLPPGGWDSVTLRDQLVVRRGSHQMTWYRDGVQQQTWAVTLGVARTPTPLGRTFVLGRSTLPGTVYAGVDVLALGSVPDNVNALPAGLRGAHIGIHTWYNTNTLGKDASDGCIRIPKAGQEQLLAEVIPGTEVVVVD